MRLPLLGTFLAFALGCVGCLEPAEVTSGDGGGTPSPEDDAATVDPGGDAGTSADAPKADTGGAKADSGGPPGPSAAIEAARVLCVDEINAYRATEGKAPYAGWTSASACADGQSKSDSESGTAHGAFGKCGEGAQNECPGWSGAVDTMLKGCLKMMWAEGPGEPFSAHGHYINMSSTGYSTVACGFYQTPGGDWWAVQDFR